MRRIMALVGGLAAGAMMATMGGALAYGGELGEAVDVAFKSELDGTTQKYVKMAPKGFDEAQAHDVLIVLHGYGADRWQMTKTDKPGAVAVRGFAGEHNMIVIAPDYRLTDFMGPRAEADLAQIIGLVKKEYKVKRVFLAGGSMGGCSVLIFAALHPELAAGVCSLNGSANMMEFEVKTGKPELKAMEDEIMGAIAKSYGGDKKQKPEEYRKRSPELTPERFTMAMAFVVGAKDPVVKPDSVRRLAGKLREMGKKDVLLIDRPEGLHEPRAEDVKTALEFMVKAADEKASGKK